MRLIDFVAKQLQAVFIGDVLDHDSSATVPQYVCVADVEGTCGLQLFDRQHIHGKLLVALLFVRIAFEEVLRQLAIVHAFRGLLQKVVVQEGNTVRADFGAFRTNRRFFHLRNRC